MREGRPRQHRDRRVGRQVAPVTRIPGSDVEIDLAAGPASATVWTNDLTYDYVKENAEYST